MSLMIVFLISCNSVKQKENQNKTDKQKTIVENNEKITNELHTYTGQYESKTGVMVDISCYCFQVGYFTATSGEELVICFHTGTDEAPCSENLQIEGYFETKKIEPDNNSHCPAGNMELFYVTNYKCL